jgi:ribosomal-protein-alanine N-acetyltransferase
MLLGDIKEIMAIERQSFPLPWSANTYYHEISSNENSHYIVVRQKFYAQPASFWTRWIRRGEPQRAPVLGYGGFWLIVDEAHISTIATAPPWRGRGLGELLLLAMIEKGLSLGAHIITLEVRVSNSVAQNLYRKYGFVIVGRRKHYYRDNGEDAFIMTAENVRAPEYAQQLAALQAALLMRLCSRESPLHCSGQKARL